MLKSRILTALILIPLVVLLILKSSTLIFFAVSIVLVLWAAWEWSLFLAVTRFPNCFFYPLFILIVLLLCLFIPITYLLYAALIFWFLASVLVLIYPEGQRLWGRSVMVRSLMGMMVLIPCVFAINWIHASENGPSILLFLFILIWGADSGAYFVGKKWGTHQLLPNVSPGKTWEGLLGCLIITVLISLGALWGLGLPSSEWPWAILLSLITVLFSIVGDLFESMLKRNVGLKDSGQWLPGHGGLLDRIDSLTAAAPVFAVGSLWMGKLLL
jgi:phosphatidate cytidylyltransferase